MSRNEPESIIDIQLAAYNARNIDSFVSVYDAKIEVFEIIGTRLINGIEEFRKTYSKLFKENPDLKCTIEHRTVSGPFVIDIENIVAKKRFPNGTKIPVIYQVESGKIRRVWIVKG